MVKRPFSIFLFGLALLLLAWFWMSKGPEEQKGNSETAGSPAGVISGKILGLEDFVAADIKVVLNDLEGREIARLKSTSVGLFDFSGIRIGTYEVRCFHEGFEFFPAFAECTVGDHLEFTASLKEPTVQLTTVEVVLENFKATESFALLVDGHEMLKATGADFPIKAEVPIGTNSLKIIGGAGLESSEWARGNTSLRLPDRIVLKFPPMKSIIEFEVTAEGYHEPLLVNLFVVSEDTPYTEVIWGHVVGLGPDRIDELDEGVYEVALSTLHSREELLRVRVDLEQGAVITVPLRARPKPDEVEILFQFKDQWGEDVTNLTFVGLLNSKGVKVGRIYVPYEEDWIRVPVADLNSEKLGAGVSLFYEIAEKRTAIQMEIPEEDLEVQLTIPGPVHVRFFDETGLPLEDLELYVYRAGSLEKVVLDFKDGEAIHMLPVTETCKLAYGYGHHWFEIQIDGKSREVDVLLERQTSHELKVKSKHKSMALYSNWFGEGMITSSERDSNGILRFRGLPKGEYLLVGGFERQLVRVVEDSSLIFAGERMDSFLVTKDARVTSRTKLMEGDLVMELEGKDLASVTRREFNLSFIDVKEWTILRGRKLMVVKFDRLTDLGVTLWPVCRETPEIPEEMNEE